MRTQTDSLTDSPTNSPNVRIIGDHKIIINNNIAKSAQQLFVFVGPFYKVPTKYSNDDRYKAKLINRFYGFIPGILL